MACLNAPAQRRCIALIFSFALLSLGVMVLPAFSADWPQHLGPDRNGLSAETGLIDEWPQDGPKEVFRVPGGVGMSGLAISRGSLITMVQKSGKQFVVALDAATGKSKWETPVAPAYNNTMGNGPRATPTIVENQVFALTGEGILVALDFKSGQIHWSQNLLTELGGEPADYGMACSPIVVGNNVIVTVGAANATVVACNIRTGETAWTAGTDPAGYSSPALLEVAGHKQLVVFSGGSVLGITPDTGTLLWRYPYKTDYDCNIATPLGVDGKVFISCGENHGSALLAIKPVGDKIEITETWLPKAARAFSGTNGKPPCCSAATSTGSTTSAAQVPSLI